MTAATAAAAIPLCVDLDGTLIHSDALLESMLRLVKRSPQRLVSCVWWLLRGRAELKAQVASRVSLDPATLPYNREFLAWLRQEHAAGREIWLCTAANERLAAPIARYVGVFSGVIASDSRVNLAGQSKAERLVQHFGEGGFDYCGNEWRDLAVWRRARGAVLVAGSPAVQRRGESSVPLLRTFRGPTVRERLKLVWRAVRPHQWAKNALLLVPVLAAHRSGDLSIVAAAVLGIISFCLCASSAYVLNDILDLEADRAHARKSRRPFASGGLPLWLGLAMFPVLLGTGALVALLLPPRFQVSLAAYYTLTVAYSVFLKRFLLIDVVALAGLYTLRIIAGAGAASVALSFWLLLFSVFLFQSLAIVKRYAELDGLRREQRLQVVGRGYRVEDLAILRNFGTAAGYLSVLVLALYINSPEIAALYRHPKVIWILCILLLYWISRVWMEAHRGGMHDDPVVYALRDRVSLGLGVVAALTVAAAI
jgi:4-hydroxybenzoate polyprenyltransferase